MKKIFAMIIVFIITFALVGCDEMSVATRQEMSNTLAVGALIQQNQPSPTDIQFSEDRYNLIRKAYTLNGMKAKALSLICPIKNRALGYIILFDHGAVVGSFPIEGKATSLNCYLTPDSELYQAAGEYPDIEWLPDIDGTYGVNDDGIFFFTPDVKYIEWNGTYVYSDIPFIVDDPVIRYAEATNGGK